MSDVTIILQKMGAGDSRAASELLAIVYQELRKLAKSKMAHEYGPQTLQATALVHEVWLRLGADAQPSWQNRAHFFAAAAEAMRRILIDRARRRRAQRHGGGQKRLDIDEVEISDEQRMDDHLLAVNEAVEKLAAEYPQKADLVKLRYFAGFTLEEAAKALNIPEGTAKHWWTFCRSWLYVQINGK